MKSITIRHNKILERLSNAIQHGDVSIDQVFPGSPGLNRPDIVVREGNKVTIIDVTGPFDNDSDTLGKAAKTKQFKYNYLIDFFSTQNMHAKVFGFVVGALGSWYDGNEKVLDELDVSRSYRTLNFAALMLFKNPVTFM